MVVCTLITGTAQYGSAGVYALWPLLMGWSIAGVPVSLVASNRRVGYGVITCAVVCFSLVDRQR